MTHTSTSRRQGPIIARMSDPFRLQRFVDAQDSGSTFAQALAELSAGRKQTHWMWFIFPQVRGLGSSPMAREYAISGPEEAHAYLLHPVLGPRLRDCTASVNQVSGRSVDQIFGYPDNLKFHSSLTLFAWVVTRDKLAGNEVFGHALNKFFCGNPDRATLDRLPAS
jgi:uncharacterized protein (DUF1810 family)